MCTSDAGYDPTIPAQKCLVQIETWADDPANPENAGVPAGQLQHFYEASFLHELGHCVMIHALRWGVQIADLAKLFLHNKDGRAGAVVDWSPSSKPWEEHIVEAAAEMLKLASYEDDPVFGQRANWSLPQSNWSEFVKAIVWRWDHRYIAMNPRLWDYSLAPNPGETAAGSIVLMPTEAAADAMRCDANVWWGAAPLPPLAQYDLDLGLSGAKLAITGNSPPMFDGVRNDTDVPAPTNGEPATVGAYPTNLDAYRREVTAMFGIYKLSVFQRMVSDLHDDCYFSRQPTWGLESRGVTVLPLGEFDTVPPPDWAIAPDGNLGLINATYTLDKTKAEVLLMYGTFDWEGNVTNLDGLWTAHAGVPADQRTRLFNWLIGEPISPGDVTGRWDQYWQEGTTLPPGVTGIADLTSGPLPPVPLVPVPDVALDPGDQLVLGWVVAESAGAMIRPARAPNPSPPPPDYETVWENGILGHTNPPGSLAPGFGTYARRVRVPQDLAYPTFHPPGTMSTVVPGDGVVGLLTPRRKFVGSREEAPVTLSSGTMASGGGTTTTITVGEQDGGTVHP